MRAKRFDSSYGADDCAARLRDTTRRRHGSVGSPRLMGSQQTDILRHQAPRARAYGPRAHARCRCVLLLLSVIKYALHDFSDGLQYFDGLDAFYIMSLRTTTMLALAARRLVGL